MILIKLLYFLNIFETEQGLLKLFILILTQKLEKRNFIKIHQMSEIDFKNVTKKVIGIGFNYK